MRALLLILPLLVFSQTLSNGQTTPFPKARFASHVTVDVSRSKKTKTEGGDFDDKKDRISFKITLKNSSPSLAFDDIGVEFYLFSQNQSNTKAFRLMQVEKAKASVGPLKDWSMETPEIVSAWDNTGYVFGNKYKGWVLRLLDPDGNLLLEKTSTSYFTNLDTLPSLKAGSYYSKELKPVANPNESGM